MGLNIRIGLDSVQRAGAAAVAPSFVSGPTAEGPTAQGGTLTATYGAAGFPPPSATFRWFINAVVVGGATASTFVTTLTVPGDSVTVEVTLTNGVGSPAVATSPAVVITANAVPATATATNGAKTLAGAGEWPLVDNAGFIVPITGVTLASGTPGAYVPSLVGSKLRFTGGGAGYGPAGCVYTCTYAGGSCDVTIGASLPGVYSITSLAQGNSAYISATAVKGDSAQLRHGDYNMTAVRTGSIFQRTTVLPDGAAGAFNPADAYNFGYWFTVTRDAGKTVRIGSIEGAGTAGVNRYLRIHDLTFVAPFQADGNGIGDAGGPSNGVAGIITLNSTTAGTGYFMVSNCNISHTRTVVATDNNVFRGIAGSSSYVWITNTVIDGCRQGIIVGGQTSSNFYIRKNVVRRALADSIFLNGCNDSIIEGNLLTDKLFGYTQQTITGITLGNPTVITVADTTGGTTVEPHMLVGIGGALGPLLNETMIRTVGGGITPTTVSLNFDSTGFPAWDGLSGVIQMAGGLHGDGLQITEFIGGAGRQDRVTLYANICTRGNPGGVWPGGQGFYAGNQGSAALRNDWVIVGNIFADIAVRGISIGKMVNGRISSNTVVRTLGARGDTGAVLSGIFVDGTGATGNKVTDNIAHQYSFIGGAVSTDISNNVLTLVDNKAVPANAADIATMDAALVNPPNGPNTIDDPWNDFATRLDAGGTYFALPIKPGANAGYVDYVTLTPYADPRP